MFDKASLTAESLAAVLEQSNDCVKLVSLDGNVVWMNANGMCAMEIDSFDQVCDTRWDGFWPDEIKGRIQAAYEQAGRGETVRFTAPCPTAKGTPRHWEVSVSGVRDGLGTLNGYVAISRDVTQAETDREAIQILIEEMRHRLKNTYAIVTSLMRGVARGDSHHETFANDMAERISALAAAQSLFHHKTDVAALRQLIEPLTAPFVRAGCPVDLDVDPAIMVDPRTADAIALVLGELAVNSSKHGAIAHGGQVKVTASDDAAALAVQWIEQGSQPVAAQSRDGGQGLKLMRRILAARQGTLAIDWESHGLIASLNLPKAD